LRDRNIHRVIKILKQQTSLWKTPAVGVVAQTSRSPFMILISCILSLRTKDGTTSQASRRLFALANNPKDMLTLKAKDIEEVIYPVGFYRNKAQTILEISRQLVEKYDSEVPDDLDELLKLRGVGRKTANLVLILGYGKPAICVDTHVHRISNRLGYVSTRIPEETEMALREKLPLRYWMEYNNLLVSFGQHICLPVSPRCSQCPIGRFCDRVGVKRSR
jgi:endonuclease-3